MKTISTEELLSSKEKIEDICFSCKAINILCNQCPVNQVLEQIVSRDETIKRKAFAVVSPKNEELNISEINFEKNPVLLAQNSLEDICFHCEEIGIKCDDCFVHEIKRALASLPLLDIPEIRKKVAKKTGGGCGTSCSTGCGTKKK